MRNRSSRLTTQSYRREASIEISFLYRDCSSMASPSCALEIAGGGTKPAFFGRDLRQRPRHRFPSLHVNPRRRMSTAVFSEFQQAPPQTASFSPARLDSVASFSGRRRDGHDRITPQKLDEWMRESVLEIVRNVGEAPFLVQIFSGEGEKMEGGTESKWLCNSPSRLMVKREAATAESWPGIEKRWEEESRVPDGVILVEELDVEDEEEGATAASREDGGGRRNGGRWGVVIQGRGLDCSACYILNTCRVGSSVGFCTHFCLVRAQCFGEPVGVQLKNAWLQPER